MNCKQGDLAIVVRSVAGNAGKIVRCEKFVPNLKLVGRDGRTGSGPGWAIDPPLPGWSGRLTYRAFDSALRPIRDSDGEDEILRIAGKPTVKEKATCPG